MDEEYGRFGKKRHNPVSSIQVRASSSVSAPCPFWRILSERDASNCSAVKEKPHFQADENCKPKTSRPFKACPNVFARTCSVDSSVTAAGRSLHGVAHGAGQPGLLGVLNCHLLYVTCLLDAMEGPLNILPRIQQSYWTSMRATRWVLRFCQFQQ